MKVCSKCNIPKEESEFHKKHGGKNNLQEKCKPCRKIISAAHYQRTKEIRLKWQMEYYKLHSKKIKVYNIKYRLEHKEAVQAYEKERRKLPYRQALHNASKARYRANRINRTPKWVGPAELKSIRDLYKEATRLTKETGISHHVDHIIPLRSPIVSGFHCLSNLQILTAEENMMKSNTWAP
jgi:hypothetical protein